MHNSEGIHIYDFNYFVSIAFRTIGVTFIVVLLEWVTHQVINPRWLIKELESDIIRLEENVIDSLTFISNNKIRFIEYRDRSAKGITWGVNLGVTSIALAFLELEVWISEGTTIAIFSPIDGDIPMRDVEIWFSFIFGLFLLIGVSIYLKNIYLGHQETDLLMISKIAILFFQKAKKDSIIEMIAKRDKDICIWTSNAIGVVMLIFVLMIFANMNKAGVI